MGGEYQINKGEKSPPLLTPTLMAIMYHILYRVVFSDNGIQPDDGQNSIGRNM
jgi:hypothetical protein